MPLELLSLSGPLKGEQALANVLGPSTAQGEDAELCIVAGSVDSIDVVGATAIRMRISRHLREHPSGHVQIMQPRQPDVAARFCDILHPLPDGVDAGQPPSAEPPAHFTLLPATPIADSEDAQLIGDVVWDACADARISSRRAAYIAEAAMELSDNAVAHAVGAVDPPIVAVSSVGRERTVEVAVTDAGTSISEAKDPNALLRDIPGRALKGDAGFLSLIINKAGAAGVDVGVRIMAGTGRLVWAATQHRVERRIYVPGTTVVVRVRA